jgi:hypothetical protein
MVTNSNFNFTNNTSITLELPFSEHIEELRQRLFLLFWIILLLTSIAFLEVKIIVKILELPISNVKFFQTAPCEYFISTLKISFYTGLLFTSPFVIGQLILFLLPGLTKKETKIILPLLLSSLLLFGLGLTFSYYTLVPAALNFFLTYTPPFLGSDLIGATYSSSISSSDRVGPAQMYAKVYSILNTVGQKYLFQINNSATRSQVTSAIQTQLEPLSPYLDTTQTQITCNATNNTDNSSILTMSVVIKPIISTNSFAINLSLTQ